MSLRALCTLAAALVVGCTVAVSSDAQQQEWGELEVNLEVVDATREGWATVDRYVVSVEITNPHDQAQHAGLYEARGADGTYYDNDCASNILGWIEAETASTFRGCYTIPSTQDLVAVVVIGWDYQAESARLIRILPFTDGARNAICGSGGWLDGDNCQAAQAVSYTQVEWKALNASLSIASMQRERGVETDRYAIHVDATNTGTRAAYMGLDHLDVEGRLLLNECRPDRLPRVNPGETRELAGCYSVPGQAGLETVRVVGAGGPRDEPAMIKIIPFREDERTARCGPDGDSLNAFCETAVDPAGLVRDVGVTAPTLPVPGGAAAPDVPSNVLLSRAEYTTDAGELVLHFDEAINPFSIYVARITILHDKCDGIALSASEFKRVGGEGTSVTFVLDEDDRQSLQGMINPRIRLAQGAFTDRANGTENDVGDVPLYVSGTGAPPRESQVRGEVRTASCTLTYGLAAPPSAVLDAADYGAEFVAEHSMVVRQAIRDGFEAWTQVNPGIVFEEVTTGQPDIIVRWIEYTGTHEGSACLDCLRNGAEINVVLEQPDCRDNPVAYGPGKIRNTIAHEFGHNLGLGHTDDMDHLMFGTMPPPPPGPFNSLGYSVPEEVPGYLVGEKSLSDRYNKLYEEYSRSSSTSHKNSLVDPINSLARQLNCMRNAPDS